MAMTVIKQDKALDPKVELGNLVKIYDSICMLCLGDDKVLYLMCMESGNRYTQGVKDDSNNPYGCKWSIDELNKIFKYDGKIKYFRGEIKLFNE